MSNIVSLAGPPSFYGRGVAFPLRLDATKSRPLIVENEDLIFQSMDDIINTDIAERPFLTKNGRPYGTRCRRIIFDSADVAIDIITYEVKAALDVWEPRVIVDKVTADEVPQAQGGVLIMATTFFRFRATNRADNLVTPFRFKRPT